MTGDALAISQIEQDRRITILEENAKRFDRDLQAVKHEMNQGFQRVEGKIDGLGGKVESVILQLATQRGQVQGGWWATTKIVSAIAAGFGILLAALKYFAG